MSFADTLLMLQEAADALQAVQSQAAPQQVDAGDLAEAQQNHDEALHEVQEVLLQVGPLATSPCSECSCSHPSPC